MLLAGVIACTALVGLASAAGRHVALFSSVLAFTSYNDIWIADLERGFTRALNRGSVRVLDDTPSWSPDGSRLAFATIRSDPPRSDLAASKITITDIAGRDMAVLAVDYSNDYRSAWSPDGSSIAFRASQRLENGTTIYLIDLDAPENEPRLLLHDPMYDTAPSWWPDGSPLVMHSLIDGAIRLVSVDISTGEVETLLPRTAFNPQVSPDGGRMAYWLPALEGYALAVSEIGGEPRSITASHANRFPFAWSPDGISIAYGSVEDAREVIRVVDVATGEDRIVFYVPGRLRGISWRP